MFEAHSEGGASASTAIVGCCSPKLYGAEACFLANVLACSGSAGSGLFFVEGEETMPMVETIVESHLQLFGFVIKDPFHIVTWGHSRVASS